MLGLFEIIIKYPTEGEGSAERQALLATDLTKFETSQQFYDHLGTIHIQHFGQKGKPRNALNNNIRTTKRGNKVVCKVPGCGGNHYANECTKTELMQKYKRDKPDEYERYMKRPKCRHGKDCRRHKEGKCRFSHDEGTASNNRIGTAINMYTQCHSTQAKIKNENELHKWILDNGSAKHFTNNRAILNNIKNEKWKVETQNGISETNEVGDVSEKVKDVILNKQGSVNILSEQEYLQQNKNTAFITTTNKIFSVPIETIRNLNYHHIVAELSEGKVYELTEEFKQHANIPTKTSDNE